MSLIFIYFVCFSFIFWIIPKYGATSPSAVLGVTASMLAYETSEVPQIKSGAPSHNVYAPDL